MKYQLILIALLLAALSIGFIGCDKSDDDDKPEDTNDDDDATTDDDDNTDDDDTTDDDDDDQPAVETYYMNLDFELLGKAHLDMIQWSDKLTSTFYAGTEFDIISEGTKLQGDGVVRRFDGGFRMYAMKFVGPSKADSPCGSQKISYSVTLSAKEKNGYLSGGFTAYCGDNVFTGKPARVYRLSGLQVKVE